MKKVKFIVHEQYSGKQKSEDIFATVFLSNAVGLTDTETNGIMKVTEQPQDPLCSVKGATSGTIN